MTDSKNLREGDKVTVNLVAKGTIIYGAVKSASITDSITGQGTHERKVKQ